MQAVTIDETGGTPVLVRVSVDDPEPGPDDLVVRLASSGVNFRDTQAPVGRAAADGPFVPGTEGAGTVVAVGRAVRDHRPGDRVAWWSSPRSYAEYVRVPRAAAVRVPSGVDLADAAAMMLQGLTAHYLVTDTYRARAGESALVHAAAGGLGGHLVRLLSRRGVRVIATVSARHKASVARAAGAHEVVVRTEVRDLAEEVRSLTLGKGVAVVYDGIGRDTFEAGLRSLRPRGTFVLVGAASVPGGIAATAEGDV